MSVDAEPSSTVFGRVTAPALVPDASILPVPAHAPAPPSVQAPPHAPAPPAATWSRMLAWAEARALFITAVAVVIILSLAGIPAHLAQDGYLALVAGRIVAAHGVPHRDFLTIMAHGVRWTDQQWLAQLAMYEVERIGGLPLLTVAYTFLTGIAFALTVSAARRLGGRDVPVLAMLPLGGFFYLATAVSIRTQGLAYPLFVATLWLLADASRRPFGRRPAGSRPAGRRELLVFPILVLWANVHGSVTLGVGMAGLYGLTRIAASVRAAGGPRGIADPKGLAFVLGAPLTLFATPYGLSIIRYYRVTLFNPDFAKIVSEWKPVTAYTILAVPLLLLIVGTAWSLGRSGRRTPAFDQIVLAVLGFAAIDAVRNITWFGLAVMMLLPAAISTIRLPRPARPRRPRVNHALVAASLALVALTGITTLARPTSWFQSTYPKRAVPVLARMLAAHPRIKIFADVRFADWLIWEDPAFAGHVAYDTSLENLTDAQLNAISTLAATPGPGVPNTLGPYPVLMLYPTAANRGMNRILLARRGTHVVLRSHAVVIATKPIS
jgi:hypothetical protein